MENGLNHFLEKQPVWEYTLSSRSFGHRCSVVFESMSRRKIRVQNEPFLNDFEIIRKKAVCFFSRIPRNTISVLVIFVSKARFFSFGLNLFLTRKKYYNTFGDTVPTFWDQLRRRTDFVSPYSSNGSMNKVPTTNSYFLLSREPVHTIDFVIINRLRYRRKP